MRQTFYQCVSRNWISNDKHEYRRLGDAIKNGRRAGLIDWSAIEDRTRNVRSTLTFDDPADRIKSAALSYSEDLWLGQEYRPEVWIEKDALVGVIEGVCEQFRVPYFSCRGNVSEPEMYAAGKRFEAQLDQGLIPIVLHLGDHDPNGLDMTRDIRERLELFARQPVKVKRLGLNFEQTTGLPPNFAKEDDPHFAAYERQFGTDCWELDALDPTVIADLIRTELDALIDPAAWNSSVDEERANLDLLEAAAANWPAVENFLAGASS